jgi:dTMP kinase
MLITLEGLDGSGKTTCREALAAAFPDLTFTREPTGSWYGDAVRQSINTDDADPLAELFLYTADHAAHVSETIEPALARGETVISDRYSDSRFAYQGATLADRFDDAMSYIREIHQPWTRPPDRTIYLDIDPETAAERSGATNKFETATALEPVRDNYERLIDANPSRFIRVDATAPKADLRETVVETVAEMLDQQ